MSEQADAGTHPAVTFLADQPSADDRFGSHSRVAKAVAGVIRDAEAINVIGLLGGWGSGKSTVVRAIETALKDGETGNAIHVFNYDAWLHQNDPPRRAFLEERIANLTTATLIAPDEWEPRLAELSGRSEETVTDTTRFLSPTGKWIFASLGLVPVGLSFLDFDLIDKAFGAGSTWLAFAIFTVALLLTSAPLVEQKCGVSNKGAIRC
jgi:hypothetical protein